MRSRAALVFLSPFLLVALGSACASIWGFEDAKEMSAAGDGGAFDTEVVPAEGATGVVCVPRPPAEWQGPVIIDEAAPAELKECPAPYGNPLDAFANLVVPPDGCNCRCSKLECTAPTVTVYNTTGACAADSPCGRPITPTEGCTPFPPAGCALEKMAAKITVSAKPTPCKPMFDAPAPTSWGAAIRVCSPPADTPGTCPSNKVATPAAPIAYRTNYCVAAPGLHECPSGYPAQRVYHQTQSDTRACDCSCSIPDGASCSPTVRARDDGKCGAAVKGNVTEDCSGELGTARSLAYDAGITTPRRCDADGGVVGDAEPTNATTICCRR